jgi:hypothetical protein
MRVSTKLIGSIVTSLLAVVVLVAIQARAVEVVDGVVLVAALAILARTALRSASDSARQTHPHK